MILNQLLGQLITVTFQQAYEVNPPSVQGTLKACDGTFVWIETGSGKPDVFIPLTSIHRIEPVSSQ